MNIENEKVKQEMIETIENMDWETAEVTVMPPMEAKPKMKKALVITGSAIAIAAVGVVAYKAGKIVVGKIKTKIRNKKGVVVNIEDVINPDEVDCEDYDDE